MRQLVQQQLVRHFRCAAMGAALVILAAACGGGDDSDGGAAPTTSPEASVPATTVPATTVPATTSPATTSQATTSPETTSPATTSPATTVPPTTSPETTSPAMTVPLNPPSIADLIASGNVLNIAHAGGDQDYPHSTMYAYAQSVADGANMLEMDVWLTADGVIIVQHDADTQKTTDQTLVVADTDLATLQALDNAYWFSPECWPCQDLPVESYVFRGVRTGEVPPPTGFGPDDFRIITLAELAAAFPHMPFDIEIKPSGEEGAAVAVALADELARLGRLESSIVVSFDSATVAAFHAAAPDVATSPGVDEMAAWLLAGTPLADYHDVVQIPPVYDDVVILKPETLQLAADSGVAVWVWPNDAGTQENQAFYESLVDMGVTGILAGRPAQATAAIEAASAG
jgi:glycerophosphoryl diester phosphodiesterase